MSIRFQVTHQFSAPHERVYQALTDLSSMREWMPGFVRYERVTEGPLRVGSRWRETRRLFGKEATEQFEVTDLQPPDRIGLRVDGAKGSSKRGEFLFTFHVWPYGSGTKVEVEGELREMGKVMEWMGMLIAAPFKRAMAADLRALDAWLERKAAERAGTPMRDLPPADAEIRRRGRWF